MKKSGYVLRLDPWAAEYDGAIQEAGAEEPAPVDVRVEFPAWRAVRPAPLPRPESMVFVDGVRRVEHRLLIGAAERTVFGLLGSFGVGAARVDSRARVIEAAAFRVAVAGSGLALERFAAPLPRSSATLVFEPRSEPDDTPAAPLDGLQKAMRQAEAALAERLSAAADVVFQDGPLSFVTAAASGSVVGLVKRLQRSYLEPALHALLPTLATAERTPLFLIGGRQPRYSWYLRIAVGRAIESALTGIVRLETRAERGLDEARRLADLAAREIPRFASDAAHDPRAPQNLYPVGGLETRLKHLLGDPLLVRRAIEARIHGEVSA